MTVLKTTKTVVPLGPLPNPISAVLRCAGRRIRTLLLLRYIARSLCLTSLISLVAVTLGKLHVVAPPSPLPLIALITLGLLLAIVFGFTRNLTEIDIAKLTERRLDLKERISSAVEFRDTGIDAEAPFYSEQLADASRSANDADLRMAFPIRIPKLLYLGVLCVLALVAIYFLPTLPVFWSPQKKAEVAEVKQKGMEIIRLAVDKQKTADQQKLDETRKAAEDVKKIGEAMSHGKMTKKESLVALQKLTQKIDENRRKLDETEAAKMRAAAADLKQSLAKMEKDLEKRQQEQKAAELAQKQQLKNGLQPQSPTQAGQKLPQQSHEMEQSKAALNQMAEALQNMDKQQMQQAMDKLAQQMASGKLTKEEMKQLADAMQKMANSLKDSGQNDAAQQMEQLAEQMNQGQQMNPENMQQMANMAKSIGQKLSQGGMSKSMLDAKQLAQLSQELKDGRLTMVMGSMPGPANPNGAGRGQGGHHPGKGYNGTGQASTPMKDPGVTDPKLIAAATAASSKGVGKSGSAAEFAKYASMTNKASSHLPNGKIAGSRSANGQEIDQNMTGDPQGGQSNTPYYNVYQTSKKQEESTLNKENIPAAYKDQVRKYFEEIRP